MASSMEATGVPAGQERERLLERLPSSVLVGGSFVLLVVIGAENRAVRHRLFFGYNSQRLLDNDKVAVVIVVPSVARLTKH